MCTQNVRNTHGSRTASKSRTIKSLVFFRADRPKESKFASAEGASRKFWGFPTLQPEKSHNMHSKRAKHKRKLKCIQVIHQKIAHLWRASRTKRILICERRRREQNGFGDFHMQNLKKCPDMCSKRAKPTHDNQNASKSPTKNRSFLRTSRPKRILLCERRRREQKILGIFTSNA